MPGLVPAYPPEEGLWRVARGPNPFALREPPRALDPGATEDLGISNRFDSAMGNFRVWYFATKLEGCYGETLAVLRPSKAVRDAAGNDEGYMPLGEVPADWRNRRVAVRATLPEGKPFLDVEAAGTRAFLTDELGWLLDLVGVDEIDVSAIRSQDRRLTRWISQWVRQRPWADAPGYAGMRFCSRLNTDWELWAVFEDVLLEEQERRSVLVQDEALRRVAELWKLDIY